MKTSYGARQQALLLATESRPCAANGSVLQALEESGWLPKHSLEWADLRTVVGES